MVEYYDNNEAVIVPHPDKGRHPGIGDRAVCPACKDHKQLTIEQAKALVGPMDEPPNCKNLFLKGREAAGQCCCWAREHL